MGPKATERSAIWAWLTERVTEGTSSSDEGLEDSLVDGAHLFDH